MLSRMHRHGLVARGWLFLIWFDLAAALLGRTGLESGKPTHPHRTDSASDQEILSAMATACCFYWRPVLCLQRSVCTVRMLRAYGHSSRLVVGYRPKPFMSHAWVEIDGRVANDSPAYAARMRVLHVA